MRSSPANPFGVTNRPLWRPGSADHAHQEVWYLKLNDPEAGRALWLRFTLLLRADGSKRVAETWAISFERRAGGQVVKIGAKNTYPSSDFTVAGEDGAAGFRINGCTFSDRHTAGEVKSAAHSLRWDLSLSEIHPGAFDFVPASLRRLGLVRNTAVNLFEDLSFTGWTEVDGERFRWEHAPGMQGHLAGPKNGHSWAWAHCNTFLDGEGRPAPLLFDGLSARARLGGRWATPLLSTFYLCHQDREYVMNRFRDAIRVRSKYSPGIWTFELRPPGMSFRGTIRAGLGDFAGVTYEDTDGSLLYCYNSKVSDMTIEAAGEGQCERFEALGTVAFEFVTRERHPDIPLII
jgi:hypothetical protein